MLFRHFTLSLCTGLALLTLASRGAETTSLSSNPRFTGSPFLRTWQPETYGAAPVNWQIQQHPRTQFLYVGNNYGLLEFDGATWRTYELPGGGPVRSFAIDDTGKVWAGSLDEIVTLTPDAQGKFQVTAVTSQLPPGDRAIGNVTRALATPQGVYFTAVRAVFRFRDGQPARRWEFPATPTGLWWQNDKLHISLGRDGIFRLEGDAFQPAAKSPDEKLALSVFAARPIDNGMHILLSNLGPFRWHGASTPLEPISPTSEKLFRDKPAEAATFLADGTMVFGYLRDGLRVLAADGTPLRAFDEAHGLASNRIEDLFTDTEGGVWIAQRSGLTRVQLDSPFALHGVPQGLSGSPRLLRRFNDRLYIAHNEGVVWRDESAGRFQAIPGLSASISTLFTAEGKLYGPGSSLHEISTDNSWRTVLPGSQLTITPVPGHAGFYFGGNTTGVTLLRFDGKRWSNDGRLANVPEGATRFRDGNDGKLWAVAYNGTGIWRLDLRGAIDLKIPAQHFTEADGLPPSRRRDSPRIARIDGEIIVTSAAGTRRFDPTSNRFTRDLRIAGLDPDSGAMAITSEDDELWWFTGPPYEKLGRVVSGESKSLQFAPVTSGPLRGIVPNSIYRDVRANTLWIAGQGGLVSFDLSWQPPRPRPALQAFVRSVTDPATDASVDLASALSYQSNQLRFTFAAPSFETDYHGNQRTEYRTRLAGLEENWSAWSETTFRDFTNLPYRELVFHVQGRALDGRESAVATAAFKIMPPWWLTRWAFAAYIAATLLFIVAVFVSRTRSLRQRNAQLAATVTARTAELERLRQIDRDESAAAKLAEEKARLEMLRYQLNPHFLYNALNSIRALVFTRPPAAGDMVSQLAELCRVTLTRNEDAAPVSEEFAMLQLYLDMEKTRWRDSLEVEFALADAAATQVIPPFLLLPLVENALKHGRQTSPDILKLRISAHVENQTALVLAVANTGEWLEPGTATAPSTGIGLENLRQRLKRYYPDAHTLTTEAKDDWVTITLFLNLSRSQSLTRSLVFLQSENEND
ncbi:histidine kinase [Oleiharenicola lentus]|uniref:sensor histidine kinase n=1 Tax=Oleiharenicola lentus TaxID=2508720 RepID=UPI003F66F812